MLIRILASCCFMMLPLYPTATVADCGASSKQSKNLDFHVYTLRVTSKSFLPVEILGSVAFGGAADGYRHIASTTPFEISVTGLTFLAIFTSANAGREIGFTLDIDGENAWSGGYSSMHTVGENVPTLGGSFSTTH